MDEKIRKTIINSKPIHFGEAVSNSSKELIDELIHCMRNDNELRTAVNEKINALKSKILESRERENQAQESDSTNDLPLSYEIEEAVTKLIKKIDKDNKKRQAKVEKIEQQTSLDNHYFMKLLENDFSTAYTAVKNGLVAGLIEYKDGLFNFKCKKGCVGLIFNKAGCTEYKTINKHILINGEEPKKDTLKNCTKNTPPKEWDRIEQIIFPNNPEIAPDRFIVRVN
jgi:hypothetical protein